MSKPSSARRKRTVDRVKQAEKVDSTDKKTTKILKTDADDETYPDVPSSSGDSKNKTQVNLNNSKCNPSDEIHTDVKKDSTSDAVSADVKSPYFSKKFKDAKELDEASDEDLEGAVEDEKLKRLSRAFYEQPCEDLAKALLGQVLVRIHNGERLAGRIIETESYLGRRDKAAHSYKGKTDRNAAMFMDPGTSYVYNIYGMYCCMNISSQGEGEAVLIRSLEPLEGKSVMTTFRTSNKKKGDSASKPMKERDLCNGPSKLTQALNINKASINQVDLTSSDVVWLERGEPVPDSKMVVSKRINIAYAEEWTDKLLRFYELGNPCVSVKDKAAEKLMKEKDS